MTQPHLTDPKLYRDAREQIEMEAARQGWQMDWATMRSWTEETSHGPVVRVAVDRVEEGILVTSR